MAAGCWVCEHEASEPYLSGTLGGADATADDLRITDARYGMTAPLVRCLDCGFIYAEPPPADDLVALYTELDDPDYVEGHDYRLEQMRDLLGQILPHHPTARTLLDVGAGSGLLVEAAQELGLQAVGVEPSVRMVEEAQRRGLTVLQGIHPHPELAGRTFDLVTCADVIEHVTDPVGLLRGLAESCADGGRVVVTTPDVESVARRLMGARWWHFRTAHVCFFPASAMERALERAGLRVMTRVRQKWTFSLAYLGLRAGGLLGGERARRWLAPIEASRRLNRIRVPVDLRDSWVYVCERR